MAPILATWCPDILQDNGSFSDLPCRPSGSRRSSLLAFITRGTVRNDVRDDDLHLTRCSIPLANIILRCVLPGAFSAPRVMRATRSCAPYYDRVRLYRVAIMDISNMLRLTRDPETLPSVKLLRNDCQIRTSHILTVISLQLMPDAMVDEIFTKIKRLI